MGRLLKAEWYILRKSKWFWLTLLIFLVPAALNARRVYDSAVFNPGSTVVMELFFAVALGFYEKGLAMAIAAGIIVGGSVRKGLVENPLALGAGRGQLYISKWLGQMAIAVPMVLLPSILTIILRVTDKGFPYEQLTAESIGQLCLYLLSAVFQAWAYVSIFCLLLLNFGQKIRTVVLCAAIVQIDFWLASGLAANNVTAYFAGPFGALMHQFAEFVQTDQMMTSAFFATWLPAIAIILASTFAGIMLFSKRDAA